MSITKLLLFQSLSLSILLLSCTAQNTSLCSTSSCGSTTISYPFRLRSDPYHCGFNHSVFTLDCLDNQPILTSGSQRYNVEAITYSNYSIRLTDPGLKAQNYSTCPTYSSSDDGLSSRYMVTASNIYNMYFSFISCSSPANNPSYLEDPTCGNATVFANSSRVYSYIGMYISPSELEPSCVVDKEGWASSTTPLGDHNYSYSTVHDFLSFGFERSWYQTHCQDCHRSKGTCLLENNNKIRCKHYCYEDTPLSERSFRCKLEFYAPVILLIIVPAIGGIILLRCLCAMSFAIPMILSRRRKEKSSMAAEGESQTIDSIA